MLENCKLCAFNCDVNRVDKLGVCRCTTKAKVALASVHMWEEPCISRDKWFRNCFLFGV